ncbi:MAG: Protein archease [Candidatus Heimdallarchaeota archaeon LC_3]|nr:MAG: Protein archease [Candidatus Heimdallarchaeota archaeon LC_3]
MNDSSILENVKFLDDEATADVAFIASGKSLDEAFANAGLALYHTIVDLNQIEVNINFHREWKAEDLKGLLYDFLDDLIYFFDTERLLLSIIKAEIIKENENLYLLKIDGGGESYNLYKHDFNVHIKAVTFFGMEIGQKYVKVTLDI